LTSAAQANSLVKVFSYKLVKAGYSTPAKVSIGLAYGRALMIKAGHNGGGTAHVVYIGDVVNAAAKLAAQGCNGYLVPPMMIDPLFASNLNEDHTKLVTRDWTRSRYTANPINIAMNDWYQQNCTQSRGPTVGSPQVWVVGARRGPVPGRRCSGCQGR